MTVSAKYLSLALRRGEPAEPATRVRAVDAWYLGYAAALAQLWRFRGDGALIRHLLAASGLTFEHLRAGGVDELDLNEIEAALISKVEEVESDPVAWSDASEAKNRAPACRVLVHVFPAGLVSQRFDGDVYFYMLPSHARGVAAALLKAAAEADPATAVSKVESP